MREGAGEGERGKYTRKGEDEARRKREDEERRKAEEDHRAQEEEKRQQGEEEGARKHAEKEERRRESARKREEDQSRRKEEERRRREDEDRQNTINGNKAATMEEGMREVPLKKAALTTTVTPEAAVLRPKDGQALSTNAGPSTQKCGLGSWLRPSQK